MHPPVVLIQAGAGNPKAAVVLSHGASWRVVFHGPHTIPLVLAQA